MQTLKENIKVFFAKNFPPLLEENFKWERLDSIALVELIVKLENHFSIEINPIDLDQSFKSIETIEKMVQAKIEAKRS